MPLGHADSDQIMTAAIEAGRSPVSVGENGQKPPRGREALLCLPDSLVHRVHRLFQARRLCFVHRSIEQIRDRADEYRHAKVRTHLQTPPNDLVAVQTNSNIDTRSTGPVGVPLLRM